MSVDKIRIYFVLPKDCAQESEAADVTKQAFESCKQNLLNASWVQENNFSDLSLAKTDVVVFQEFKGQLFESLKETKCVILGPWCLLICLMKGTNIPNYTWPIYNVAMANCIVSCSHIPKSKKLELEEKIQLMGGCYTKSLMSTNTHLVTGSAKSEKYLQAAERGLKLFSLDWVEAVWEASQNANVHCDEEQFNKYKCPPLHNLTISATGLSLEMRSEVAKIVAKNGGTFTANLTLSTTDVLIVSGEAGIMGKKYKVAKSNPNIYCVKLDWIYDSIKKGYALGHHLYSVNNKLTSTPTKADATCPNFSILSAIGADTTKQTSVIEDTLVSNKIRPGASLSERLSPNKRKYETAEIERLVDGLDIKKAKRAGQYLDGCNVYLAGFKAEQREKLSKILNLSGATRYEEISDRVTHIIVGDANCPEWLLDSMEKQQVVDEENYLINIHDFDKEQFSSPLGRKGLSLLRSNKTLTSCELEAATSKNDDLSEDDEIMQQYSKPTSKDESDTLLQLLKNNDFDIPTHGEASSQPSSEISEASNTQATQDSNIFYSKTFQIVNFAMDETQLLKQQIENVLGTVVSKNFKGIPDFVVAPAFITSPIQLSALEVVNNFWISDCLEKCDELPISYYHRPLMVCEGKPLEGCVVTISGYLRFERSFLGELIEVLGGISQEQLARISAFEKNIKASTHLISLHADGKKYKAALKWELPVIEKDWLLECAKTGQFVSEEKFLMGEAKAPVRTTRNLVEQEGENNTTLVKMQQQNTPDVSRSKSVKMEQKNTPDAFKSVLTPSNSNHRQALNISRTEKTPVNQKMPNIAVETPISQVTPINKLMAEVRKTNLLGTPQTPEMPKTYCEVDTPESPFGCFIKPHLSPKSKKELMKFINKLPDFVPPPQRRLSTPLSEVKRRCLAKFLGQEYNSSNNEGHSSRDATQVNESMETEEIRNEAGTTVQNNEDELFLNSKFKQIEEMVSAMNENRRSSRAFQSTVPPEVGNMAAKESQPFTVGWDYNEESLQSEPQSEVKIFIISGAETELRQSYIEKLERLGGQVSELSSYDPKCTHLICCSKPARNEKTLSCIAAGKWILHCSYVDRCVEAGKFLPEEEFEFGNPKSRNNIKLSTDHETEERMRAIHWWRKEIAKRGYGAFNDMRAIVVAPRKEPITRVIEAGGGQIVDASPPFEGKIYATHCLIEVKGVKDFSVYNPLAEQGVLCINTLYISDFLFRTNRDIKDAIVPHLSKFY